MSDSLRPHGLQHARLPCLSSSPRVCSNSYRLSFWCHPTISFSATLFSFCLQSFPASESFPMSQLFPSGGQSIGASASVLPVNVQGWFPLGLTGLILQSKGLSGLFSGTTVQKHQFFSAPPSFTETGSNLPTVPTVFDGVWMWTQSQGCRTRASLQVSPHSSPLLPLLTIKSLLPSTGHCIGHVRSC